ncbi:MAG: tetratricopeptide repeat protein, partial [Chloroflexota bacterium]
NPIAAQQSLAKIIQINGVSPEHLNQAADGLVVCQNYTEAATCLVRALELNNGETHLQENTDTKKQLNFELLTQLTNAYHLSGESQLAIEAIDQALTIKPAQAPLIQQKGNLLLKLGHTKMAAEWNMSALEEIPDNADLRLQAAHIQRALGNLSAALEFANESYHLAQQSQDQCCSLDSVILAADLHIAMMNNDQALELLNQHGDLASSLNTDAVSNFYCMLGELAIRNNEEIAAANVLTKALSLDENHPRALALKARMKRRQGDLNAGSKALETSLEGFGGIKQMHNAEISSYVALAETALEYQAWSTAIFLLEEAAKIAPEEPLSYILLAQTLVQQAEYQHLYRTLNVDRHGQGDSALSKESYQRYDQAVLTASRLVEALQSNDIHSALSTYLVRGQAIFKPDAEHAKALLDIAPTADNLAAYLTILRASNNKKEAAQAALEIYQRDPMPTDPFLLSQIALVLIRKAPKIASSAAQQTVDESIRSHSPNPGLYLALQAYVAHRVEDHVTHLEAVETLLTHWEDEPDWHARAADLLINQQNLFGDNALEQAVTHLQKATQLAPRKEIFQLKLGEAYLHLGNSTDAITALEKAIQLDPDSIQSQLMLAKAVHRSGNHHQAKKIAEQIAKREPNDHGSSLLLAKLTIQENKAETALQYLDHVLQLKPQHPEALLTKAEALSMLGSYPEALTIFETAMVRQPQSSELRLEHVDLVKIVHGKQTALETLEKYNEQYPDDIPLQIRLGDALAENGHREEAIICAQRTMKLDDLLTINQKAQILKLLGSLLRQSGQLDQAITHLNNAVEQDPQWSEPYIELGRTYQQRRQYDRALDSYQQAIDLDPANPQAYHRAGMVLKDSKDYINAEQMLRKAATLDSKDIGIQRKLAAMIALNLVHQTNQPSTQPTTP